MTASERRWDRIVVLCRQTTGTAHDQEHDARGTRGGPAMTVRRPDYDSRTNLEHRMTAYPGSPVDCPRRGPDRTRDLRTVDVTELLCRIDLPAIVSAQVDRAAREVPAVAALPEDVLRGPFADALGRATGDTLRALVEQRSHTEQELEDCATRFTEVMAVWGLVIDDIVAIFARGAQVLWEAAARHATPAQLRVLLRAGGGALDSATLVERIATASADHLNHHQIAAERAARTALMHATVDVRAPHPTSARTFVALRPDVDLRGQAALAAELRAAGLTAATSDGHVVGSLPGGVTTPQIDDGVVVTEALPRPGSREDRQRRLHEVLALATRRDHRPQLTDLDLAPERLLAANPGLSQLLRSRVATVAAAAFGQPLVDTAAAFVEADGDVAATARALGLHRESVRHRLRRIEELTGLNLSRWHGRCTLSLALRAQSATASPDARPMPPVVAACAPFTIDESATVRAILERVDQAEVVRKLVEIRRAEHPGLATTLASSDVEEASAAADVQEVLALIGNVHPSRDKDLVGPSRRTLEYLRLDIAAEDIVAIGRSTPRVLWHAILDASTDEELRHLSSAAGRLILYVEATQLAITHAVEPDRLGTGAALLEILLDPETTDLALIALAAEDGLTVDTPQRGFVVALGTPSDASARRIAMDLRAAGWAALPRSEHVYGIAPPDATDARLDEHLPPAAVFVLGEPTPLRELRAGFRQLGRLVDLALAGGLTGPLDVSESTLELLLSARPDIAHAFRESIVAPLARRDASRDSALVATLHEYVAHDFQRGPTSTALHLHRNSLDYRLRQITREIGRTFSTIDDVFAILLGVTADRLLAASGEGHDQHPRTEALSLRQAAHRPREVAGSGAAGSTKEAGLGRPARAVLLHSRSR